MKTLIKSLALAFTIGVVTSAASFANTTTSDRPTVVASYKSSIYMTIDGKLSIALDKQTGGVVDVRLKNAEGKIMYDQHLSRNESKYRTRLNLDELPDGEYQVEMTNGVETTTHKIIISTKNPITSSRIVALN